MEHKLELKETGIKTKATFTNPPETLIENPTCPKCGGPLEIRKFVDAWGPSDKPCDINEDFYCPKCDIRWEAEPGPHNFSDGEKEHA